MFGKEFGIRSIGLSVAALMWGATPLMAQAIDTPPGDVMFQTVADDGGCVPGGGVALTIAAEPRPDTVKSAPFSGVGTTEVVTTLADGNRIVRTNTMRYFRDSRGRTRTEYSLAAIGPFTPEQAQTVVTITDPVNAKRYVLHSSIKRADVFKMPDFASAKAGSPPPGVPSSGSTMVSRTRVFSMTTDGPQPSVGGSVGGPGTVALARAAGPGMLPASGVAGPMPVAPPVMVTASGVPGLPPASAGFIMQYSTVTLQDGGCRPNAKPLPSPSSLGERIIEGLKVSGTRMEFTIPMGAVGNEQPIVVSSEQWFSPELGVVVSSTHRDPMMGDTSYKLEQINRAEPDASLFAVPADYTVNEVTMTGPMFFQNSVALPEKGTRTSK